MPSLNCIYQKLCAPVYCVVTAGVIQAWLQVLDICTKSEWIFLFLTSSVLVNLGELKSFIAVFSFIHCIENGRFVYGAWDKGASTRPWCLLWTATPSHPPTLGSFDSVPTEVGQVLVCTLLRNRNNTWTCLGVLIARKTFVHTIYRFVSIV